MTPALTSGAIKAQKLSKLYKLYDRPTDRVREALNPFGKKYHKEFYALTDVSFEVSQGEAVGIIGKNGSGKSTLLKLITGVLTPTTGNVAIGGTVSALLELGAGFNPEMTGLENIYLHGALLGDSKSIIDSRRDEILSFADIGVFIGQPVKTYSSGMFVRLAFAVALSVDPDILIIDEALSVGDMRFQQKCLRRIEEIRSKKTVLFVSHDLAVIGRFCDRAIWIDQGRIREDGPPSVVSKQYHAFMIDVPTISASESIAPDAQLALPAHLLPLSPSLQIMGDREIEITGCTLLNEYGASIDGIINPGQKLQFMVSLIAKNKDWDNACIGFSLQDRLGNVVTQTNTYVLEQPFFLKAGKLNIYKFTFQFPLLNSGPYTISPAVATGTLEAHVIQCWVHDAIVFNVSANLQNRLPGIMYLDGIDFHQVGA